MLLTSRPRQNGFKFSETSAVQIKYFMKSNKTNRPEQRSMYKDKVLYVEVGPITYFIYA